MSKKLESKPVLDNPEERVITLFKAIQKLYKDRLMQNSREHGFTGPQLGLLMALHQKPGATLNEISEFLGLSKSTVSGIVDRLVAQGAVVREVPEENRRTVRLSLSAEFSQNNFLKEFKNKFISDVLQGASDDELLKINIGLEILLKLMQNKPIQRP